MLVLAVAMLALTRAEIIERMKAFNGHVIIQTMFMRGSCNGESVDNTSEEFVAPWLDAVMEICPQQVMVYTIDRETPAQGLEKASREQLDAIRDRVIALFRGYIFEMTPIFEARMNSMIWRMKGPSGTCSSIWLTASNTDVLLMNTSR